MLGTRENILHLIIHHVHCSTAKYGGARTHRPPNVERPLYGTKAHLVQLQSTTG